MRENKIEVVDVEYSEFLNSEYSKNALINTEYYGFEEDYLIIHCLLKKHNPKTIFEIGTYMGNGCRVMKNSSPDSKIFTLDIVNCGQYCPPDVEKIVFDSMKYDYSKNYPIDCWFIDGNHTYENVYHETKQALLSNPNLIIYHDADIPEVFNGIIDSFNDSSNFSYKLYRVVNPPRIYSSSGLPITRVLFAEKR